jgi:tetrapyrrole methylase family protein/MazG family protein
LTEEATRALVEAREPDGRCYGLTRHRELVAQVAPGLRLKPVDYLFAGSRAQAFADLTELLTRKAFAEGQRVVYVAAGNALVLNDAVYVLRRECAARGLPVRVVVGVSFLDVILEEVFWSGHFGLEMRSAWDVDEGRYLPDGRTPVLLYELGEGEGAEEMVIRLRNRLMGVYPGGHRIQLVWSSGSPEHRTQSARMALSELSLEGVEPVSNVWLPALGEGGMELGWGERKK